MFNWSTEILRDQFDSLTNSTRIVFAHPLYVHQQRVVHYATTRDDTGYVCLGGDELTAEDLQQQVEQYFESTDTESIHTIIVDECDRASQEALNSFFPTLIDDKRVKQFIVISRIVAHDFLENEDFRAHCQFIPTDDEMMLYDYAQRDDSKILVEVRAFGGGRVHINGRLIEVWDGQLPRLLFFYFADRGMVTRNDIFATFWSNLTIREATNVFHVTKRKITDILKVSFTKYWSGFYRVAPNIELSYDVMRFSELIQSSVIASPEDAIRLLENAISLYRSPYLNSDNSDDAPWIETRRAELHTMFGEAQAMLAKHKLEANNEDQALGHYLGALKILIHREEIVENVMKIYERRGKLRDALDLFHWIENNLNDDLGMQPSESLQQLADSIEQQL